jgi:hypothetical protein
MLSVWNPRLLTNSLSTMNKAIKSKNQLAIKHELEEAITKARISKKTHEWDSLRKRTTVQAQQSFLPLETKMVWLKEVFKHNMSTRMEKSSIKRGTFLTRNKKSRPSCSRLRSCRFNSLKTVTRDFNTSEKF